MAQVGRAMKRQRFITIQVTWSTDVSLGFLVGAQAKLTVERKKDSSKEPSLGADKITQSENERIPVLGF